MSNDLIFLDTETTGLDPNRHEVWEVAFAVGDGPIATYHLEHHLRTADVTALEINGHGKRFHGADPDADLHLRRVLTGATIVGSNPAFDAAFLSARWGYSPWHHRMVAVESMAMQEFGWDRPKGLADVTTALRAINYDIPQPDHSAAGDVATLRAVYRALRDVGERR